MRHFLFVLFVFYSLTTFSQRPSQAEINKRMKEAKAIQEQIKNDPEYAEMLKAAMESSEEDDEPVISKKAPKKDLARLSAISPKVLSKAELVQWSRNMYNSFFQKLNDQEEKTFLSAVEKLDTSASSLEDAAILNWISDAPNGALLFALKASYSNGDDPMYWNNLAAMFNLTGQEDKAIPILKYLANTYPGSAMIYNNLGQAYLGLGETTIAKKYLDSCLKYNPTHPEANHSMGLIYRFMGNITKSNYHFEQETRVCYREPVVEELKKVKKVEELYLIMRPRWPDAENYFGKSGLNSFRVPDLPESVEQSNLLYQAHIDFRKNVAGEIARWAEIDANIVKNLKPGSGLPTSIYSHMIENVFLVHLENAKLKKLSWLYEEQTIENITYPTPGTIAGKAGQARNKKYLEDLTKITLDHLKEDSINSHAESAEIQANPSNYESIKHKYNKINIDVDIKYCKLEIALADKFILDNAQNQPKEFQQRIASFPDLINEAMFYASLAPDDVSPLLQAHNLIILYLTYLDAYSAATIIAGTKENGHQGFGVDIYCDVKELEAQKYELAQTTYVAVDCNIKLVVPLGVAKLSLDCKKIGIEMGQGFIVGANHAFKSGNTTLTVGVGVKSNVPFVDIGAKQMVYVTFDRDGNYTDAGIKGEAGVSIGPKVGVGVEAKVGYQVGIHSGASTKTEMGGKITLPGFSAN